MKVHTELLSRENRHFLLFILRTLEETQHIALNQLASTPRAPLMPPIHHNTVNTERPSFRDILSRHFPNPCAT